MICALFLHMSNTPPGMVCWLHQLRPARWHQGCLHRAMMLVLCLGSLVESAVRCTSSTVPVSCWLLLLCLTCPCLCPCPCLCLCPCLCPCQCPLSSSFPLPWQRRAQKLVASWLVASWLRIANMRSGGEARAHVHS